MKTKFFKEFGLGESMNEAFKFIVDFSPKTRKVLVRWVKELDCYPRMDTPEIRELCGSTGESAGKIESALKATITMLDSFGELGDRAGDFVDDLKELDTLDKPQEYDTLRKYFIDLEEDASRIFLLKRSRKAISSGAQLLQSCSLSAALKPIYREMFKYGELELVDYRPKAIGYIGVVLIELMRSGSEENFSFQIDRENFNRFVSDLLAVQMELKEVEKVAEQLQQNISK